MLTFVLGSGRCGSTLVTELIARHPDVGFISNVDDKLARLDLKGRWNNALFARSDERDPSLRPFRDRRRALERGRLRVAPSEGWLVLEKQISSIFPQPCRDLTAQDAMPWLQKRIADFFDSRIEAQGKPAFVHHLTGWPRSGLLRSVYPEARFVHVVRDGRSVANSWLQMVVGRLPRPGQLVPRPAVEGGPGRVGGGRALLRGARRARMADPHERHRGGLRLVPEEQWLDVRLEDFMDDPRGRTEEVLDFLGLEWTPQYEAGFAKHTFQASREWLETRPQRGGHRRPGAHHRQAARGLWLRPEPDGSRDSVRGDQMTQDVALQPAAGRSPRPPRACCTWCGTARPR